jgi:2-polyprenyl-3-methyl-5-hydroxy-6-metoxy-1,4-benzoquinol methylase
MLPMIDNALMGLFGLPYLYVIRDFNIHSRCRYLLRKIEDLPKEGISVLDIGCGSGIALCHLDRHLGQQVERYVGIDLRAARLRQRFRDLRGIRTEFYNVDLDEDWDFGRFDLVWCSEVIEHLFDDAGQLAKMRDAVKPGGRIVVTAPCLDFVEQIGAYFPPILKTSTVQDGGHVRHGYRAEDLARLAASCGLTVESIDGVTRLSLAETKRRYTARGIAWLAHNVRKTLSTRQSEDFALGQAFERQPQLYRSIAAEFVRPPLVAAGA